MKIEYKRMTEADIENVISLRVNQLIEEHVSEGRTPPEGVDLESALRDFYTKHMTDGSFVSWLAIDVEAEDKIVGTSGMSFAEKPPYFTNLTGGIGILSSMFTDPDYRRMGIGRDLLHRVVEEARSHGCGTVYITASDMGVKLYTAYGFKHNGNFMQINL